MTNGPATQHNIRSLAKNTRIITKNQKMLAVIVGKAMREIAAEGT